MEQFKQAIAVMIGCMAHLPENHPHVVESAERVFYHLQAEVATILEVERQCKIKNTLQDGPSA